MINNNDNPCREIPGPKILKYKLTKLGPGSELFCYGLSYVIVDRQTEEIVVAACKKDHALIIQKILNELE